VTVSSFHANRPQRGSKANKGGKTIGDGSPEVFGPYSMQRKGKGKNQEVPLLALEKNALEQMKIGVGFSIPPFEKP